MAPTTYRSVGHPVPRIDTVSKLTGQAVFAEDFRLPQAPLHGAVLRSPHPHARIVGIDTSRAEALPGVRAVVTAADLPHQRFGQYIKDEEYLSWERVRYVGDRLAAVAADTPEIARAACALIQVRYEVLPTLDSARAALAEGAPAIHPELAGYTVVAAAQPAGGNVASLNELSRGDPEAGFAQAARVFEETYTTEMVHQAYLEPHACQAVYNPDRTFTVWSSTQGQYPLRNMIAEVLGVPQNHVRVVATEVGGGFGGKIHLQDEAVAAALARKAGRPVRVVMTREEDFLCGNPRSAFEMHIRTGVSADGKLLARTFDMVLDSGAYGLGGVLMAWSLPQFAEGPYAIPHIRVTVRCTYTNKPPCSSFRAPGGPQTNFAIESEMERIAEAMGWDSVWFRRRNLMPEGHQNLAGMALHNVMAAETLDAVLRLSGYDAAHVSRGPHAAAGLALGNWNVGGMPSGAVVKLNNDGSASLLSGVVDLTGVNTALAQIVAEVLALPVDQVTVSTLDTESAPHATSSVGSQALKSMGLASLYAAEQARRQLFELAVEDLDVTPERMELAEGHVRDRERHEHKVAVTRLIARHMGKRGPVVGQGGTGTFTRMPSFAANVAEVDVDPDTGQVRLTRFCAAQDVGQAINPIAVEGQVQGGVVQGIGMALSEGMLYRAGRVANAGFLDYKIPSAADLPDIETVLVEVPASEGPFGAKGIGEPPVVAPPAAIANA
ncbi:MAG: xanthine dehydrogenase family protein molybdopterin-binding subunit, partial [Candidatus Lambdaproteobacteria bacterium]|nr:xanthine dehydrogenase family protein molybdopterin-binding subunit [Candidatus Lambdaproteobacteria bacterium]